MLNILAPYAQTFDEQDAIHYPHGVVELTLTQV